VVPNVNQDDIPLLSQQRYCGAIGKVNGDCMQTLQYSRRWNAFTGHRDRQPQGNLSL